MEMVRFNNLVKDYHEGFWGKKVRVLHGITFSVPKGKIFGFLGANGAGKTTSFKVLLGLQKATSGTVELFGKPIGANSFRENLGYLPERPYLHDYLAADEFLNFHRSLFHRNRAGLSNEELLKLVGLPGVEKRTLRSFSKGMLQRIGIAQALINDPELIILDEPMSGLDPLGRREIRNLIANLGKTGKTVFFSSHILSDIESLCDEIAFLEKGRLKYCGKVQDLLVSHDEFEIIFDTPDKKVFTAPLFSDAKKTGESFKMIVTGDQAVKKTLEQIWIGNGKVTYVGRLHKNLEEVLFGG